MIAPDVLVAHSMAWTEGLFGVLVVGAVALLDVHLARPSRRSAIALLLVAAAAPMTRYAGLAVPIAVAFMLLVAGHERTHLRRWGHAALIGGGALLPFLLWVTVSGHGVARSGSGPSWHPPDHAEIRRGFAVVAGWFHVTGPRAWKFGVLVLALVFVAALANGVRRLLQHSAEASTADQTTTTTATGIETIATETSPAHAHRRRHGDQLSDHRGAVAAVHRRRHPVRRTAAHPDPPDGCDRSAARCGQHRQDGARAPLRCSSPRCCRS